MHFRADGAGGPPRPARHRDAGGLMPKTKSGADNAGDAIEVGGVRLTSPEKVLYPEQGITKRELAEYYLAVADVMLPHVAGRPMTMVRCPTGRAKKCFYQRHAGSGVPPELAQVDIAGFEESGAYLYIEDAR